MPDRSTDEARAAIRSQVLALRNELGRNPTSRELYRADIWKAKRGGYPTLASLFKACGMSWTVKAAVHRGPRPIWSFGHLGNDLARSEARTVDRLKRHNAAHPYHRPVESDIQWLEERAFA